ncbi:hypothetical protein [Pseudorhodoferax sp. Leaf274]|uniref:hypothetical protein n=1 Tax=Pseudorhodoferax sp. Leaf274 TaxID=1736318 RepID=UPI0012E1F774|nr:hypothetical protein [Pseudorhodoferax sp. Leaf274]
MASFVFEGYSDEDTRLIAYREMPDSWMGRIGRGIESSLRGTRLGLYPDATTRRRLGTIASTDVVLFFAMENLHNIASIAKYVSARRLHVFLWNPVARIKQSLAHSRRQVAQLKAIADDIHTFDQDDAMAYGLHIAPQPYRHVPALAGADAGIRPAFYFSGVDKGRLGLLLELKAAIEQLGLDHHFHVVADRGKAYAPPLRAHLQDHWIPYARNLRASQRAACLVEIIQHHQSGPTLRSMEALFLQKKIVTNRASARDDRFFDPDRVLVIDRVDAAEIGAFMRRPFKPVEPGLLAPHEIHAWIRQVAPLGGRAAG